MVVRRARLFTLETLAESFENDPLVVDWLHETEGLCGLEGNMTRLDSLKACLRVFYNVSAKDQLLVMDYVFTGETIPLLRRVGASAGAGAVD